MSFGGRCRRLTAVSEEGEQLLREVHRKESDLLARLSHGEPNERWTLVGQVLDHEAHGSVVPCWTFGHHRVARELSERALIVLGCDGGAFYSVRTMVR